jgi:hypothetical protein
MAAFSATLTPAPLSLPRGDGGLANGFLKQNNVDPTVDYGSAFESRLRSVEVVRRRQGDFTRRFRTITTAVATAVM